MVREAQQGWTADLFVGLESEMTRAGFAGWLVSWSHPILKMSEALERW